MARLINTESHSYLSIRPGTTPGLNKIYSPNIRVHLKQKQTNKQQQYNQRKKNNNNKHTNKKQLHGKPKGRYQYSLT